VLTPRLLAQTPPAPEPAPPPAPEPTPAPAPEPAAPPSVESTPAPESSTPPEAAAPVEAPLAPEPSTGGPAPVLATQKPAEQQKAPAEPRSLRAHWPLTLEGKLGFSWRPESAGGFHDETRVGAEVGLSLYLELKRELAAGLEIERTSLGRGTAISRLDSVTVDYSVSSALLGLRAYPWRTELLDLFVGFQIGVGIQGISAAGTSSDGSLAPAVAYTCGASDSPAFQIGGGVGARLMLTPRWGVTARAGGMGRRLSGDLVDDCARGIGTSTTIAASVGVGYDFDLEP
jgi:hypothetical protein